MGSLAVGAAPTTPSLIILREEIKPPSSNQQSLLAPLRLTYQQLEWFVVLTLMEW